MLLNPKTEEFGHLDEFSCQVMRKTIAFFETKGKGKLKQDHFDRVWYDDFLGFIKQNKIFASLLTLPSTPAAMPTAAGIRIAIVILMRFWVFTGWPTGTPGKSLF
jgi:hypothetical protein